MIVHTCKLVFDKQLPEPCCDWVNTIKNKQTKTLMHAANDPNLSYYEFRIKYFFFIILFSTDITLTEKRD